MKPETYDNEMRLPGSVPPPIVPFPIPQLTAPKVVMPSYYTSPLDDPQTSWSGPPLMLMSSCTLITGTVVSAPMVWPESFYVVHWGWFDWEVCWQKPNGDSIGLRSFWTEAGAREWAATLTSFHLRKDDEPRT